MRSSSLATVHQVLDCQLDEASATHQEVLAGLGAKATDREHVFAFLRNPEGAKDPELNGLIETLRRELSVANVVPFSEGDLDGLCQRVTERLKKVIDAEAARFESQSTLEQEKEAHSSFARERSGHFVGRTAVLGEIDTHLEGNDNRPLVVHGLSGCGKSAIIARASEESLGIRRFIGVTPESSNGLTLLRSLCGEIGERYGQSGDLPATFNELAVLFQDRLPAGNLSTPPDPIHRCSRPASGARSRCLAELVSARASRELSRGVYDHDVAAPLANARLAQIEGFSIEEAGATLDLWLEDADRTLQLDQPDKLLESFRQTGLPLYLKLAFDEARLWRSFDPLERCILGGGSLGVMPR